MKIVIVHNPHDNAVSVPVVAALKDHIKEKAIGTESEVLELDFMQVKAALPITSAPCVFLLFDELSDSFDPANLGAILEAVKARKLAKGKKGAQ